MADGCGYTLVATVVEGYSTAVAEWKLYFALTLLACHFACDGAVYLVGQPVFACYSFETEHILKVLLYVVV